MKKVYIYISLVFIFVQSSFAQNLFTKICGGGFCRELLFPLNYEIPISSVTLKQTTSVDPNEIIGPEGYDSVRWVSINDMLNYTILFENDPEFATAAAQKVDVRFDFQNKAWMKSFGIGGYCFSNMSWAVAKAPNTYQQRIDLKDSLSYYVDLIAGLDVAKQQGFWTFTTIDPETGYAPWQSERGLLPVNDSTHVGEGFVTFQLKPYEGLKTGDTISIQANIVFDQNDVIATNRWCNRIDAGMPESKVTGVPAPPSPPEGGTIDPSAIEAPSGAVGGAYQLTFEAKDDEGGSGVKHLLLYMANHNGIYEEIDTVAVDSVLLFPVETGKQYKLYSIAVDNTGNREPAKEEPDVILNFNQAPTDIALSDTIFQDDLEAGGFIGRLTSVDSEDEKSFTYALAEGEGAIHNDLFQITGDQLQIRQSFKCADDNIYKVRVSTTDEGGMTFSKAFLLHLNKVLEKPKVDTLVVDICEGETCLFHGTEYDKTGLYAYSQSNEFMCDSVFVLQLTVHPILEAPIVTIKEGVTLVSSAAKGNQWFRKDGTPVEGATEQEFTPTEDGIYYVVVSNGSCFSAPSPLYRVVLSDDVALDLNLNQGWNWISVNLTGESPQATMDFLAPITDEADQLVSFANGLTKDENLGWVGNLKTLTPTEGYKLHLTTAKAQTWTGTATSADKAPIALYKGWNWIGYVPPFGKALEDAFSLLQASEDDLIKSFDDFAIYTNGQWVGTLTTMRPGEGYLYQAQQSKTLTYSSSRVFAVEASQEVKRLTSEEGNTHWQVVKYAYPDNMTMIAQVWANGEAVAEGRYTIGAFINGECRGIGKYVSGKLFLTIHGDVEAKNTVTFKAFDNALGKECQVAERCSFDNIMRGSMNAPYALHVDVTTEVDAVKNAFNIYPNPVRNTMYINGQTEDITAISIVSANGTPVLRTKGYPMEGVDVSALSDGSYVVVICTKQGEATYKIIKNK